MHDQQHEEPRRLSALYQYHNAPEVAPAHGLEYDDTKYPSSDKYPVITATPYKGAEYTGKHAYQDNRPPRIIFGMKIRTFLCVAAVMILIVIGAAVGGAVGGKSMRENEPTGVPLSSAQSATTSSMSNPPASPTTASQYSAPTPTYTPLSDCPASNNTLYTSAYSLSNMTFTKYCDLASPLSLQKASTLAEAFVYSFSDCIELCAGLKDGDCDAAVYSPGKDRPANCFVGSSGDGTASAEGLESQEGSAVALLVSS